MSVNDKTAAKMVEAIKAVEEIVPGYGVAVLVFQPGTTTQANYIGNRPRPELRAALAEVLARWTRQALN